MAGARRPSAGRGDKGNGPGRSHVPPLSRALPLYGVTNGRMARGLAVALSEHPLSRPQWLDGMHVAGSAGRSRDDPGPAPSMGRDLPALTTTERWTGATAGAARRVAAAPERARAQSMPRVVVAMAGWGGVRTREMCGSGDTWVCWVREGPCARQAHEPAGVTVRRGCVSPASERGRLAAMQGWMARRLLSTGCVGSINSDQPNDRRSLHAKGDQGGTRGSPDLYTQLRDKHPFSTHIKAGIKEFRGTA